MPLIAKVKYPVPPHRVRIRKECNRLAFIAFQIESSGREFARILMYPPTGGVPFEEPPGNLAATIGAHHVDC